MEDLLSRPVSYVKGVGEKQKKLYQNLGIYTVLDLLTYYPVTYEDRSQLKSVNEIKNGESVCLCANILTQPVTKRIRSNLTIANFIVTDDTENLMISLFNQKYLIKNIVRGDQYYIFGKVQINNGKLCMVNPVMEKVSDYELRYTNKIVPQYRLTAGLTQKMIINTVFNILKMVGSSLPETLPQYLRENGQLSTLYFAICNIHFPLDQNSLQIARKRLAFEELFYLQLSLLLLKGKREVQKSKPFLIKKEIYTFIQQLPFVLTLAQMRVVDEILGDLQKTKPMNRLVQGDVGSGKTVVAVVAMYAAFLNGFQSALMVPTEILATQHYENLKSLYENTDVRIVLLVGSLAEKRKREIKEAIQNGEYDIIIGTQALIQKDVEFFNLGLVISDEQHRFGVKQRADLEKKGANPHTLIMSATPIPRTLSLVLYGDLDISIIDELPPGRVPVETYIINESKRIRMYRFLQKNIDSKRQVYIVCPLVEESETMDDIKNITDYTAELQEGFFRQYKIALLHGKMNGTQKEEIMRQFALGQIDILVSTTVIEVGVNVPNAAIMVIEDANRFGLSQLHQLRGRVGRGKYQSYCILVNNSKNEVSQKRLRILCRSSDGFYISEEDLKLRGPGEFFGTRQHGIYPFKIANVFSDMKLLKEAQMAANSIYNEDRELKKEENAPILKKVNQMFFEIKSNIALN